MLIAAADGFWKTPNFYDLLGVAGFVVGVGSIWLTWYLAKRDISKRLDEAAERAAGAARREISRVARTLMFAGVTDAVRTVGLVREACKDKRWPRAVDHCDTGLEQLNRLLGQPSLDEGTREELRNLIVSVREVLGILRRSPKARTGSLSDDTEQQLDLILGVLHVIEGRMRGIDPEGDRG
jgi:hypothetical protein